jgi:hypothetical protein
LIIPHHFKEKSNTPQEASQIYKNRKRNRKSSNDNNRKRYQKE